MSVLGKRTNQSLSDDSENKEDFQSDSSKRKKQKVSDQDVLPLYHNTPTNIVLNVGGIKYETTIQTLTGYQSMLKARFSSKFAMNPSADETYFVDSDGELFKYILKYLRTGMLLLPTTWNKNQIWEFYAEIKYLMVESLFDKVLLKLFDSKIITNNLLKLKIIHKIKETLKWNKSMNIMESLREWKSLELMDTRIGHSLILFLIDHSIYGMFLVVYYNEEKGYYDFPKSFAFHCCENGYHLLSVQEDIDIKFAKVRRLTEEEKKDAVTEGGNGIEITYQWIEDLYPLAIKKEIRNVTCTQYGRKNQTQSVVVKYAKKGYNKFKQNSRSETWSIPM